MIMSTVRTSRKFQCSLPVITARERRPFRLRRLRNILHANLSSAVGSFAKRGPFGFCFLLVCNSALLPTFIESVDYLRRPSCPRSWSVRLRFPSRLFSLVFVFCFSSSGIWCFSHWPRWWALRLCEGLPVFGMSVQSKHSVRSFIFLFLVSSSFLSQLFFRSCERNSGCDMRVSSMGGLA